MSILLVFELECIVLVNITQRNINFRTWKLVWMFSLLMHWYTTSSEHYACSSVSELELHCTLCYTGVLKSLFWLCFSCWLFCGWQGSRDLFLDGVRSLRLKRVERGSVLCRVHMSCVVSCTCIYVRVTCCRVIMLVLLSYRLTVYIYMYMHVHVVHVQSCNSPDQMTWCTYIHTIIYM